MMSTQDILDALGGRDAVASLTGAKPRAVEQWPRIGVPFRFWNALARDAERQGIAGITLEAISAAKVKSLARMRRVALQRQSAA